MQSPLETKIEEIIMPIIDDMGYLMVRVKLIEGGKRTLQIMAERKDDEFFNVDDCAKISRKISTVLDVEDPIQGEYDLEVSSPGIDRPLVKPNDFSRFIGETIRLVTEQPIDGRKKFKGKLSGIDEENIVSLVAGDNAEQEYFINFNNIANANLSVSENLF